MRKQLAIAYIISVHVFLGFVLVKSDFLEQVLNKLELNLTSKHELTEFYHDMVGYHLRMDGNVPNGSIIFIGDSFIQGLCVSAVAPESVNYGIGGDTTVGVLQRLTSYSSLNQAGIVVVAIGFNDLKFRDNNGILRNYSAIAEQMPHNIPIIFSAVLPVNEKKHENLHGRNQRIQAINTELKAFTMKSKNLFFVNVGPFLIDVQGNLADEYHDGDGVHLNARGNNIWIIELQKTIKKAKQGTKLVMDSAAFHLR